MKNAILSLIVIILIGVLIAIRQTPSQKALLLAKLHKNASVSPYRCVAIHHRRAEACAAVKRLSGQRFLSREAPPLPLPQCDAATCRCRYVHFEDRRQGDDRRNPRPPILHVGGYEWPERRSGRDRRRLVPDDVRAGAMRS